MRGSLSAPQSATAAKRRKWDEFMTNKKGRTSRHSPKQSRIDNTSLPAQRRRVAEYLLQHGHATTIELQVECNALHSPRRVFELRHDLDWDIATHWQSANDPQGRQHRVGSYVLLQAGVMP